MKKITVRITLDTRVKRKDGTFTVSMRLYDPLTKKRKRYATRYNLTKKDFESMWMKRTKFKDERLHLETLVKKANDVIKSLPAFNFEDFEKVFFNKMDGVKLNLNFYFKKVIDEKTKKGRIKTAETYQNSFNALIKFHKKDILNFEDVTVSFLQKFEEHFTETQGKSLTTVGIYLRNVRALFKIAIKDKVINSNVYPFGKDKYQIRTADKVNKALTFEQVQILKNGTPETPEQEQAKAFWFFSYLCNGMNLKDILNLKCKDFDKDYFTFIREKTKNTANQPPTITVFLHPYAKQVIEEYGNLKQSANSYVFDTFKNCTNEEEKIKAKGLLNKVLNKHLKKYAKSLGINEPITMYWARHSFSTILQRKNKSISQIGEALGHTDIRTTMSYLAGFTDDDKKQMTSELL